MNDATLNGFRMLAEAMNGGEPTNWSWVGKHMSQRMFGITEKRAKDYAAKFGGEAMTTEQHLEKQEADNRAARERVARLEAEYQRSIA